MNDSIRLSVADNGYVLSYDDPEVRAQNRKGDGWKDPERHRVYPTFDKLVEDIPRILEAMRDFMESDAGKESDFATTLSTVWEKDSD